MRNFIQRGENVTIAAPAAVSSGDGVLVGALFGVATADAASGDPVTLATVGVYELPKKTSATFATGAVVAWTLPEAYADVAGSGKYPIGVALAPAGNGTATVVTRLDGIATAAA